MKLIRKLLHLEKRSRRENLKTRRLKLQQTNQLFLEDQIRSLVKFGN